MYYGVMCAMYDTSKTKQHDFIIDGTGSHARTDYIHRFFGQKSDDIVSIVRRPHCVEVTISRDLLAKVYTCNGAVTVFDAGCRQFHKGLPQIIFANRLGERVVLEEPYDAAEAQSYSVDAFEREIADLKRFEDAAATVRANMAMRLVPTNDCTCLRCTEDRASRQPVRQ